MRRIACVFLGFVPVVAQAAPPSRPGIVLIMADNLAPGMTGFEGHPQIKTPNLDRLAAESVYFTRCYTPTPQGAPSRASVLTGLCPHAHGVTREGGKDKPVALSPDTDTFSARLQRAGYSCGVVGKWQLPDGGTLPGFGLDEHAFIHSSEEPWKPFTAYVRGKPKEVSTPLTVWETQMAGDVLKMNDLKPFFLWLCYQAPHEAKEYPPGTEESYPPASIQLPDTMDIDENTAFPAKLRSAIPLKSFKSQNQQHLRETRSRYYAMVTHLDEQIGDFLKQVDKLPQGKGPIIIFTSDKGWAIGEHKLYTDGPFFYDELVRMPLLIRWPGHARAGTRIDRVVSLVDLAPTILGMAGETPPMTMQGRSLLPLIDNPDSRRHADECFLEYDEQKGVSYTARGIVTSRYKFIDYMRETRDALFDLRRDPKERNNVASEPEYAPIVETLRQRVDAWRRTSRDPVTEK